MFCEVVFNRPIQPLLYRIPDSVEGVLPGVRVTVPLRKRPMTGLVYRMVPDSERRENTAVTSVMDIEEVLDPVPVLNRELIELSEWMADYYLCGVGEALWTVMPKGFKRSERRPPARTRCLERPDTIVLTQEQRSVYHTLHGAMNGCGEKTFLLHGITGSGKTEVYLRIINDVVNSKRGAILLVPEISLTPQTVDYFSRRVGEDLAILHSRLTKAERINEWHRIKDGGKRIVIGARSAVFAPLLDIGIIIIDEEHETSYKSDETPRYNAKRVALYRAKKHNAILLLGSATPSVESYFLAKRGKFGLLELKHRVSNQSLPKTYVTDLRKTGKRDNISKPLARAIETRLGRQEQTILFLNRRGFSPYIYCMSCGHVFRCSNCDITLVFHMQSKRLSCHYCDYSEPPPETCPNCGSERVGYSGFGTEKVEKDLRERFPGAVIVRMDTDTVKKRTMIPRTLRAFSRREIDILVGTQIVTKGLHFPGVTLVGVLNADIPLNFPDFRSAERTFNIITQVSGRSGRSEKGGEVIIQTYNPAHYAIQTAKRQDYGEFFSREIRFRESLFYPPFCRIVRLVFRGENSEEIREQAAHAGSFIRERCPEGTSVLGPTLCPLSRIKKNYRVHIIIKSRDTGKIRPLLRELTSSLKKRPGCYMEIDIDPVSML
ncbi:MAG: primosomal protein N' [Spirochaetes bacterium]|nr:primosomal protein N' [Spirochaetota bacterium]